MGASEDDDPGARGACVALCNDDGWVEVYYDAAGRLLANSRNDPRTMAWRKEDVFREATHSDVTAGIADEVGEPVFVETRNKQVDLVDKQFVYPCPHHRPAQFLAWAEGCYKPGHRGCERCKLYPTTSIKKVLS